MSKKLVLNWSGEKTTPSPFCSAAERQGLTPIQTLIPYHNIHGLHCDPSFPQEGLHGVPA